METLALIAYAVMVLANPAVNGNVASLAHHNPVAMGVVCNLGLAEQVVCLTDGIVK